MIQKFCVLHHWRSIVNAVYGPFDTYSEAEAFAEEHKERLTRDDGYSEIRIQTRGS